MNEKVKKNQVLELKIEDYAFGGKGIARIKSEEGSLVANVVSKKYPEILSVKSENPEGYYVVIGAYSSLANANKSKYECSIENACSIFKTKRTVKRTTSRGYYISYLTLLIFIQCMI